MIEVLAGILGVALTSAVLPLFQDELRAWIPFASRRLIRLAARGIPAAHRNRYAEEWSAELRAFDDRKLTAFAWAVRVLLRSLRMRAALQEPDRPAESKAPPQVVLSAAEHVTAPMPPYLADLLERTRRFTWAEVVRDMDDPTIERVEADLAVIEQRFEALITKGRRHCRLSTSPKGTPRKRYAGSKESIHD